jgi:hypothetical protein
MAARPAHWTQTVTPRTLVTFREGVSCRREPEGPLGLTLFGRTQDHPDERASVAFTGTAPEGLPEALEDATVEQLDSKTYRIVCVGREWLVSATAAHVHREVATAFYRVVTPRPPSWSRRVFWRVVLSLARNPTGRRLLLALRRR